MEFGGVVSKTGPCLDTVRALHQTVVALRAALEQSRSEILELKSKAWPVEDVQGALKTLSIENHILRHTIINDSSLVREHLDNQVSSEPKSIQDRNIDEKECKTELDIIIEQNKTIIENVTKENSASSKGEETELQKQISHEEELSVIKEGIGIEEAAQNNANLPQQLTKKQVNIVSPRPGDINNIRNNKCSLEARICIKTETFSARKISKSLESLTIINTPISSESGRKLTISKTVSFCHIDCKKNLKGEENKETMDGGGRKDLTEEERGANKQYVEEDTLQSPQDDLDQEDQEVDDIELIFTTDEMKDSDLKEHLVSIDTGESTGESSHLLRCPVSDLDQLDISDRELDDDVFNDNYDGDVQEPADFQSSHYKQTSLNMYNSKSDNSINNEENKSLKSCCSYQDSSFENKSLEKDESFDRFEERVRIVETDISKCGIQDVEYSSIRRNTCPNPLQYRPLLHREALSKGLNARKSRPILVHSNTIRRESGAQTDISALPGSAWRSESSLANKVRIGEHFTTLPSKFPLPGSRLRLSDKTVEARRALLSDIGFTSMVPELSRSADHLFPGSLKPQPVQSYGQFLKTPDLYSPGYALNTSQRFTWTATTATPSEGSHSRYSSIYPLSPPAPSRRCSAPVSPSRRVMLKSTPSRVRFANGSLPELRGDWTLTVDSGDSTDSLVEEAENYLRRSIDCIVSGRDIVNYNEFKKTVPRRASAPEATGDNVPPQGWQPFLPRVPRDLKLDHWVKVITPEGRVKGGRVRYIGPVVSQPDPCVGVQLSTPDGPTDGTFGTRRYFQCEPYHGIFVPFKKVIMGWHP